MIVKIDRIHPFILRLFWVVAILRRPAAEISAAVSFMVFRRKFFGIEGYRRVLGGAGGDVNE